MPTRPGSRWNGTSLRSNDKPAALAGIHAGTPAEAAPAGRSVPVVPAVSPGRVDECIDRCRDFGASDRPEQSYPPSPG